MLKEIEQLLVLQDRDRKIRTMRNELKMVPVERKDLEARLATTSSGLEALKLKAKEIEVEKNKLELEAQAKRDSIAKFRNQQFQTRKNEEFQALTNEIKRFEADIQTIEDRELDLMEDAERMKGAVRSADQDFSKTKSQFEQQFASLDTKVTTIEAELQRLETERASLAAGVNEDLLSRYERLFASKGDRAIVPLEHEVCMGCHMKITTQTAVRVKANREVLSCEQCGRILYHAE